MAEEVVVKRLIEIVYVEYVDIFYKMASVKKKKNISTWLSSIILRLP